jgi:hypothetical protein
MKFVMDGHAGNGIKHVHRMWVDGGRLIPLSCQNTTRKGKHDASV